MKWLYDAKIWQNGRVWGINKGQLPIAIELYQKDHSFDDETTFESLSMPL